MFAEHQRLFPAWELLVVGYGPLRKKIEKKLLADGIEGVHLLGYQSTNTLYDLYDLAEIFALCSVKEGAPIVHFEALAAGLAIVATNSGATSEYLHHQSNALVYEEGDDKSFKNGLGQVLKDSALRCTLAAAALESSKKYDIARVVAECDDSYSKAIKHSRQGNRV